MLAKYSKSKCMHVKKAYIKKEVRESLNSKMLPFFQQTDNGSVVCVYWDYNL